MKHTITLFTALLLVPLLPADVLGAQKLTDFQRIVIADDALPVQRAAAEELATYAGRVAQQKIEVVTLGKLAPEAPGLSFFVGDGAAEHVLGPEGIAMVLAFAVRRKERGAS